MNRIAPYVVVVLAVWITGLATVVPGAAGPAPSHPGQPPEQDDVIFFRNGDVLRGRVLNDTLRIYTPYALVGIPLHACEKLLFAGSGGDKDTLSTVNGNRFSGNVVDRTVRFRSSLGKNRWEIRREKILRILFHPVPERDRSFPVPEKTDLFVMVNGDLLTGRPEETAFLMTTEGNGLEVPFSEVRSLEIPDEGGDGARVFTKAGEVIRGVLETGAISLKLDIGARIDPFYLDQCSTVFMDDGNRRAAERAAQVPDPEREEPEAREEDGNPGILTNSIGMKLKRIKPGAFVMGSGRGNMDEAPPHRVALTEPFYIGVLEVTQGQWEDVMGNNPSYFKGPRHPVEKVSWNDARLFCRKLSQLENRTYRLPTEAEWEYACRAGNSTEFPWGDEFREDSAWCSVNSGGATQEVGTRESNAWGLYDMIGNVWEWVEDTYGPYPGGEIPEPVPRNGKERVLRGGGWYNVPERCRAASKTFQNPGYGSSSTSGFRVVTEP